MFLKKLQDTWKVKSAQNYLQKTLKTPPPPVVAKKAVAHIGCIVDMDHFQDATVFYELTKELSLAPNALKIIGYKRTHIPHTPYTTPLFFSKDLGWKGHLRNAAANEFLAREYDLLINYYEEDDLLLKLMTVKTSAQLKVGLGTPDLRINDLIFHMPLHNFSAFTNELKKYLNVLNIV